MNLQTNNPSDFITVVQAYFDKKIELILPELQSLHHLMEVELRNFKYDSDLEKKLKVFKLALKRRIEYLKIKAGTTYRQKRRSLPQISMEDLLAQIVT